MAHRIAGAVRRPSTVRIGGIYRSPRGAAGVRPALSPLSGGGFEPPILPASQVSYVFTHGRQGSDAKSGAATPARRYIREEQAWSDSHASCLFYRSDSPCPLRTTE